MSAITIRGYRTRVTSHLNDPAPVSIDLTGYVDASSGSVDAHIEVLDEVTQTSVVVQFVGYEDYAQSGFTEYRFVVRDILPSQSLGISQPGASADFTANFNVQTAWDESEIGVVVFVQSMSSKEILQAAKLSDVITTWSPQSPTVVRGTDLTMDAVIENVTPGSENADFWLEVYLPNGEPYTGNPVLGPVNFTVPNGFLNTFNPSLFIPGTAPLWTFTFKGRVGEYPWDIWQTSSFDVTVTE